MARTRRRVRMSDATRPASRRAVAVVLAAAAPATSGVQETHERCDLIPSDADLTPRPLPPISQPGSKRGKFDDLLESPPPGFNLKGSRLFAPSNTSADDDGWYAAMHRSQFPSDCTKAQYLLVEDDMSHWGFGATASVLSAALSFAVAERRILLERPVRANWQLNATRGASRHAAPSRGPRWCDRPPFTLQCVYRRWSHCEPSAHDEASAVRPQWPAGIKWATSLMAYDASTKGARAVLIKLSWIMATFFQSRKVAFRASPHTWGSYRLLFQPRQWVERVGNCILAQAGLAERGFLSVHIRDSVEKKDELRSGGGFAKMPTIQAYMDVTESLARRLQLSSVFVQTASPSSLHAFDELAHTAGLTVNFTNNSRSEHDSWGGWKSGQEMEGLMVGVVNAYIASRADVIVSPSISAWTKFLEHVAPSTTRERSGLPIQPRRVVSFCCRCGGHSNLKVVLTPSTMDLAEQQSLHTLTAALHRPTFCRPGAGGVHRVAVPASLAKPPTAQARLPQDHRAASSSSSSARDHGGAAARGGGLPPSPATGIQLMARRDGGGGRGSASSSSPDTPRGDAIRPHTQPQQSTRSNVLNQAVNPRPKMRKTKVMNQAWAHTIRHIKKLQLREGTSIPADAVWRPGACLRARRSNESEDFSTIWFFGNSVSRIHSFATQSMLNFADGRASNTTILEQVAQCGKGGDWKGRRPGQGLTCNGPCTCTLQVPSRALRITFVWQLNTFDDTLAKALTGRDSRLRILPGDIVFLSSGLELILDVVKRSFTSKKSRGADGQLIHGNFSYFTAQWRSRLETDARSLAATVESAWHSGRRVFWRTSTPDCSDANASFARNAPSSVAQIPSRSRYMNDMLAQNDGVVRAALEERGLPVLDLSIIDQALNGCHGMSDLILAKCRCTGFLDHTGLHPGPSLASRQVSRLLGSADAQCALRPERSVGAASKDGAANLVQARQLQARQTVRFVRYEPSRQERAWRRAVEGIPWRNAGSHGCEPWKEGGTLRRELLASATQLADPTPSQLIFVDAQKNEFTCEVEPLVSTLRHPLLFTSPVNDPWIMNKSWLRLPSPEQLVRNHARQTIYVDLGAGMYGSNAPGSIGGASLKWFSQEFERRGAPFDRVLAWEARPMKQRDLWRSIPADLVPKLSYYNTPVESAVGADHNPWRVLAQVARPSDYVVVKLDIDNSMTELALIEQLLDGNSPASGLVDELFWEHHVAGSLLSCPRLMRYHRNSGWGTMTFNTSDTRETLAGSYDLLTRLREQGIRAHSWV